MERREQRDRLILYAARLAVKKVLAHRSMRDDLQQAAAVAAWKAIPRWRSGKMTLKQWVFMKAYYGARDELKRLAKQRRGEDHEVRPPDKAHARKPTPDLPIPRTHRQRQVFALLAAGHTQRSAAEYLGLDESSVVHILREYRG